MLLHKVQSSVATYLRCGGVVNNQNIWQSDKQERDCLVHFARLANTLLKDEESARDNHVLACHFATYLPI